MLVDTSVEVWDRVMAVNVRGTFLCCKYVIPAMLARGGGSIINIASFVALIGCSVPQDAYTASKGALISMTKSLAIQFRPHGIRTNAICPVRRYGSEKAIRYWRGRVTDMDDMMMSIRSSNRASIWSSHFNSTN